MAPLAPSADPHDALPVATAARATAHSVARSARLMARRQMHLPKRNCGLRLHFGDGTTGQVFRETVVDHAQPRDPCLLVVEFRLRLLRGRWHNLFLWECILNTPMFLGFPGFVSKLWVDRDELDRYRGVYEWTDPGGAQFYARSLWRVLELVCVPGTIRYRTVPGFHRDDVLKDPRVLGRVDPGDGAAWWRLVAVGA